MLGDTMYLEWGGLSTPCAILILLGFVFVYKVEASIVYQVHLNAH